MDTGLTMDILLAGFADIVGFKMIKNSPDLGKSNDFGNVDEVIFWIFCIWTFAFGGFIAPGERVTPPFI